MSLSREGKLMAVFTSLGVRKSLIGVAPRDYSVRLIWTRPFDVEQRILRY